MINTISNMLNKFGAIKFNIIVECAYFKPLKIKESGAIKIKNKSVFKSLSISLILLELFRKICREDSEYQGKGSGRRLLCVDCILLRFRR